MRKKRILSLLLSLAVCIAFMPAAVFADGETGGVQQELPKQQLKQFQQVMNLKRL